MLPTRKVGDIMIAFMCTLALSMMSMFRAHTHSLYHDIKAQLFRSRTTLTHMALSMGSIHETACEVLYFSHHRFDKFSGKQECRTNQHHGKYLGYLRSRYYALPISWRPFEANSQNLQNLGNIFRYLTHALGL